MSYPQPGDLDAVHQRFQKARALVMKNAREVERIPELHRNCLFLADALDDAMADVSEHRFVRSMQDEAVEKSRPRNGVPTPWSATHKKGRW